LKNDIKIEATSLRGNNANFDEDIAKSINPSRTASETVAMMTSASPNEVNNIDDKNEVDIPLPMDLEVD